MRGRTRIHKNRIGAIVMTFCLLFSMAGCANTNTQGKQGEKQQGDGGGKSENAGNDGAMGRYMEEELELPKTLSEISDIRRLADKSLVILDMKGGACFISTDEGKSWESKSVAVLSGMLNEGREAEYLAGTLLEDGSVFWGYNDWEAVSEGQETASSYPTHYYYVDIEGNAKEVALPVDNGHSYISQTVCTADNSLYGMDNAGKIYSIDLENQKAEYLFTPENAMGVSLHTCGNDLVVLDEKKAYFYGKGDSEADSSDTLLNEQIEKALKAGGMAAVTGGADDKIYLACAAGLYSHVAGGSVMEQLADGGLLALGEPSKQAKKILANDDGSFLVSFSDSSLCSYTYDPNVSAVPTEQLNIYSLTDNGTVRQAIGKFRKINPDVYVKLEVGMSGEDSVTVNDAVKNLNTRLLANEGPDILILDGMPMESYVEKGILADIGSLLDEVMGESEYFENLTRAYQKDNGIFAVPLRFQVPVLTGKGGSLAEVTDLKSLAGAVEAAREEDTKPRNVLGTFTAEELLDVLSVSCGNAWQKEDGSLDEGALSEFLTQAKRIYDADQANLTDEDKDAHNRAMAMGSKYLQAAESQTFNIQARYQIFAMANLGGKEDYPHTMASLINIEDGVLKKTVGQTDNVFLPSGVTGICAGGNNQELAKEFLKEMLSEEVQHYDSGDGFPVNKTSFMEWTRQPEETDQTSLAIVEGGDGADGEVHSVDYSIWPNEEQWQNLLKIISELEKPCLTDEVILDSVKDIGADVLTGEKKLEDGVNEIKQKIEIYIKE